MLKNLALMIVSLALFAVLVEGGARLFWPVEGDSIARCFAPDEDRLYVWRPGCAVRYRMWEQDAATAYRINDCGLRADEPCAAIAANDLTVAAIGDSFTFGLFVPVGDSYARVAVDELSAAGGRSVGLYNLALPGYDPVQYQRSVPAARALDPDLIVIGVLPNDLFLPMGEAAKRTIYARERDPERRVAERRELYRIDFVERLKQFLYKIRAAQVAAHYLLSIDAVYAGIYTSRDTNAGYLVPGFTPFWRERLAELDDVFADIAGSAGDVPVAIVYIPQRIQAVTLDREATADLDPRALGAAIGELAAAHGFHFFDFLGGLAAHEDPARLYYVIDGHLNREGQRYLGRALAADLARRPPFAPAR